MKRLWEIVHFSLMAGLLCVFILIFAGTANNVWAEEYTVSSASELVAKISSAAAGDIIKLGADITLTNTDVLNIERQLTLDLNGHTITDNGSFESPHDYLVAVKRGGNLRVKDSGSGGQIKTTSPAVYCGIKMTIIGEAATGDSAKLTVESGTIQGYYYGISGQGERHGTVITISGGHIIGYYPNDSTGIYQPQEGTLTITGGTVEGATGVEIRSGTLDVSDGATIRGTGTHYTVTPSGKGTTTIGAGIAVAQHSTAKPITVTLNGGNVHGLEPVSVKDPQGNGNIGGSDENKVTVSMSETFAQSVVTALPDGYGWAKNGNSYEIHKHDYDGVTPKWRWLRIDNDEWEVQSTYACKTAGCDYKLNLPATMTVSGTGNEKKYIAEDSQGKKDERPAGTYTVTFSGTTEGGTSGSFEWGQIARCLGNDSKKWKIGDRVVADGLKSYAFAVTENVTVTNEESLTESDKQIPVISAALTPEVSGRAVFNAKWSLPDGVTVTSATIYRGKSSTDKNFEAATLKTKGTPYDTGLRVRTGDFTLNLDSLTTGYHYVCIVIDYIEGGTTKELISDVKKWFFREH